MDNRIVVEPAATTVAAPLLRLTRELDGSWTVLTVDRCRHCDFASIEDAILFARTSCAAAPVTLWLDVDGLVVVVLQDRGWTRPLLGPRNSRR
jgi:hypothetical protein